MAKSKMGIKVALGILGPKGDTFEHLKTAKNTALKEWHPDIIGQNAESLGMTRAILEAFEVLKDKLGKWNISWGPSATDSTGTNHLFQQMMDMHNKVKHIPGIKRDRVGAWYWVRGASSDLSDTLKAAGLKQKKGTNEYYWAPAWSFSKKKNWKSRDKWDHERRVSTFGRQRLDEERLSALG
jgi:hypothetical protein